MTIKVVFFATPDIAIPSFEELIKAPEFEVRALVTQPPKPSNRGKKICDSNIKNIARLKFKDYNAQIQTFQAASFLKRDQPLTSHVWV